MGQFKQQTRFVIDSAAKVVVRGLATVDNATMAKRFINEVQDKLCGFLEPSTLEGLARDLLRDGKVY